MTLSYKGRYYCCHQGHRCEPLGVFPPTQIEFLVLSNSIGLVKNNSMKIEIQMAEETAPKYFLGILLTDKNSSKTKNSSRDAGA
ncbi:hypothetical protein V1477_000192 [Vespula maculifrons]|uniref:Uncharacterized protein n=1 Tax=Vespula maculifrons TaxID=7453 RepID=A0ABD2D273_VESMC